MGCSNELAEIWVMTKVRITKNWCADIEHKKE